MCRAERYLFSDIRINCYYPTVDVSHLVKVLRNKPHVANYVCNLRLDSFAYDPDGLEDMLFMISKLRGLKTIEIRRFQWSELSKPFHEVLTNCLGLPMIKKVSIIEMFNFPITDLGQCKGLLELSLDGIFQSHLH